MILFAAMSMPAASNDNFGLSTWMHSLMTTLANDEV